MSSIFNPFRSLLTSMVLLSAATLLFVGCDSKTDSDRTDAIDVPSLDEDDIQIEAPAVGDTQVDEPGAADGFQMRLPDESAAVEEAPVQKISIGSPAPPLDIEHWVSEGFEPVTNFESGKVYIVEFWATWCGPCIASMPHLAELQETYKDQGVRLISVSDEPLETVQEFLKRPSPSEEDPERTFAELTKAYSLTVDPDGSVNRAYMEGANQSGIPTAFLVGKTGEIEWIGHPMALDEPLQEVLSDQWDRERFLREYQLEEQVDEIMMMVRRGQVEEGLAALEALETEELGSQIKAQLTDAKMRILVSLPERLDDFVTAANQMLSADDQQQVLMATWYIRQAAEFSELPADLRNSAIMAAKGVMQDIDEEQMPFLLDTVAHLQESVGDLPGAIESQQEAVDATEGRLQERLQIYLEDLKAKLGEQEPAEKKTDAPASEDAPATEDAPAAEDAPASEDAPAAEEAEATDEANADQ